jgi:hypothetical protein
MLEVRKVIMYLDMVKKMKKSFILYDMHVHPFELMQNNSGTDYKDDGNGIYSTSGSKFIPPSLHNIKLDKVFEIKKLENQNTYIKMLTKINKIIYSHTGAKVFSMHMNLSCIDKILLLPVAPMYGNIDGQMLAMDHMFGNDDRFWKGGSIPNTIRNVEIIEWIKQMIKQYDIRAVKIHPNITGIELGSSSGKERVENILFASNEHKMPLIFHGGRTHLPVHSSAGTYASIENLSEINWGLTKEPVVIAHAATYGYKQQEIEEDVIPRLEKILSKYNNIMVDISGVDYKILNIILRKIDINRILFGSDALYNLEWENVVILLHTLSEYKFNVEKYFLQIMSINPQKYIFNEKTIYL